MTKVLAILIVCTAVVFVLRRVDVRLVLGVSAAALFALAWQMPKFFEVFVKEMANDKTVVPICSAMGFAYVVKLTGCDRHLIHMLLEPVKHARFLLIPGAVAVGFLVNTAIVSQSSTAATVGPVLIPLLCAAGISVGTAGAVLLLGASVGGELMNPGAVEIVTLANLTELPSTEIVRRVAPANFLASGTALLVFWVLALRRDEAAAVETKDEPECEPEEVFRVNVAKAAVPCLPLAILLFFPRPAGMTESVMIAAAMLVGVAAAGLVAPRRVAGLAASFFEGAGFAYTHVISLIVTAALFTEGIKATGLIELLTKGLVDLPVATTFAAIYLPMGLASATGSGIASALAVMNVLVPVAGQIGLDPVHLGSWSAVAAQLGRTMSPAAAVVMMSSTISGVPPLELVRRVAPPLLAGAAALFFAAVLGIV